MATEMARLNRSSASTRQVTTATPAMLDFRETEISIEGFVDAMSTGSHRSMAVASALLNGTQPRSILRHGHSASKWGVWMWRMDSTVSINENECLSNRALPDGWRLSGSVFELAAAIAWLAMRGRFMRDSQAKVSMVRLDGGSGLSRQLRPPQVLLRWRIGIAHRSGIAHRAYYMLSGSRVLLVLCGGNKRTEDSDIARAVGSELLIVRRRRMDQAFGGGGAVAAAPIESNSALSQALTEGGWRSAVGRPFARPWGYGWRYSVLRQPAHAN